ncbi:hypothetical protein OL330_004510 [Vibrio parahaemolyticus]|uniref:hypothetical protein n=1 Tax=Vibrio parahaemolyticus TaxID=670 RepID=UPI00235F407E|nr:hypothetical protein [Vibrio parahaemolyticus]EKA7375214.1 hypothetical protein [Vibrio parahaemolyticus]ELA9378030.1 hypothetical protein [Vibrio parahaemolyticus]ELK8485012.1 hypothetical protein [Vibrio parahaemolyticus]
MNTQKEESEDKQNLARRLESIWLNSNLLERVILVFSACSSILSISDIWNKFIAIKGFLGTAISKYHDFLFSLAGLFNVPTNPFAISIYKLFFLLISMQILAVRTSYSLLQNHTHYQKMRQGKLKKSIWKDNYFNGLIYGLLFWFYFYPLLYPEITSYSEILSNRNNQPWHPAWLSYLLFFAIPVFLMRFNSFRKFISMYLGHVFLVAIVTLFFSVISSLLA